MSDNVDDRTAPQQGQAKHKGPVETLRDGALKVSIFKNEHERGTNFSLKPSRIYSDAEGKVRETPSLSGTEPIRMARLLDKGYDRIGEFKAKMKSQNQSQERER